MRNDSSYVPLYTNIHAAVVAEPKAARASVMVAYSPDRVPDPRTVKHPLGVLVRDVLLTSSGFGAAIASPIPSRAKAPETRMVNFIVIDERISKIVEMLD